MNSWLTNIYATSHDINIKLKKIKWGTLCLDERSKVICSTLPNLTCQIHERENKHFKVYFVVPWISSRQNDLKLWIRFLLLYPSHITVFIKFLFFYYTQICNTQKNNKIFQQTLLNLIFNLTMSRSKKVRNYIFYITWVFFKFIFSWLFTM